MDAKHRLMGVVLSALTLATVACEGRDAETEVERAEAALSAVVSELERETNTFLAAAESELTALRVETQQGAEGAREMARERWEEIERSATRLGREIEAELSAHSAALADDAEVLEAGIERKRIELERWITEARLNAADEASEFEAELDDAIARVGLQLADVSRDLSHLGEEVRSEFEQRWEDLGDARIQIGGEAERLAEATGTEFHELRFELSRAMAELEEKARTLRLEVGEHTAASLSPEGHT